MWKAISSLKDKAKEIVNDIALDDKAENIIQLNSTLKE